jgi:hypothetical protein
MAGGADSLLREQSLMVVDMSAAALGPTKSDFARRTTRGSSDDGEARGVLLVSLCKHL